MGMRLQPQASRKERLRGLETQLKNQEMALRISQMMTQQLMQSVKNLTEDVGKSFNLINELQYKVLAAQQAAGLDVAKLTAIADGMRLKDFEEASDHEDQKEGYTVSDVVDEKSFVIITSKTVDGNGGPDAGIFRSKIQLATCGVPDLIKAFMGATVGTKAQVTLNNSLHEIELLGIRQPPAAVEQAASTEQAEQPQVQ
jgi:hypothetical protein